MEDPCQAAARAREDGIAAFASGDYTTARVAFENALAATAPSDFDSQASLRLNIAAVLLREESAPQKLATRCEAAVKQCDAALAMLQRVGDGDSVRTRCSKGMLRRATARLKIVEIASTCGVGATARLQLLARREDLNGRLVIVVGAAGGSGEDARIRVRLCGESVGAAAKEFKIAPRHLACAGSSARAEQQRRLCLIDLAALAAASVAGGDAAQLARSMQPRLLPRLARTFFQRADVPVELRWSVARGNHLVAKRAIGVGALALAADGVAHVWRDDGSAGGGVRVGRRAEWGGRARRGCARSPSALRHPPRRLTSSSCVSPLLSSMPRRTAPAARARAATTRTPTPRRRPRAAPQTSRSSPRSGGRRRSAAARGATRR